jgi:hypothetical protein
MRSLAYLAAAQGGAAGADRLGADQDALGVHAVQDVLEAAALLADAVFDGYRQAIEEQLVGVDGLAGPSCRSRGPRRSAYRGWCRTARDPARLLDLFKRRCARQQQHALGDLGRGDPDLLAVHEIAAVAVALRARLEAGGVEAGIGLGDGKAGLLLAADQRPAESAASARRCRIRRRD